MRKIHFYFSGSLMLGALFGGCTLPETNEKPTVVVVPSPPPTPPVVITPVPQIVANPGLIQSTNPNERLKQVKIGNKDPFAANQPTALIVTTNPVEESGSGNGKQTTEARKPPDLIQVLDALANRSNSEKSSKKIRRANSPEDNPANKKEKNSQNGDKSQTNSSKDRKPQKQDNKSKDKSAKLNKPDTSKNNTGGKRNKNTQSPKPGSVTNGRKNPSLNPVKSPTRPSVPVIPEGNSNPPIAVNPGIVPSNPGGNLGEPSIPDTPSVPQLASQVEIKGVVQLDNGYAYAIVKGPNEKTSTNVSQGDTVPNTGIVVKRIEVGQVEGKMSGTVILEENGIEVSRAVGDKTPSATEEPQASQGGGNNFPSESPPPGHDNGNPVAQPSNVPMVQPVSNPPPNVVPTTVVPTPIQSPDFGTPIPR